MKDSIATCLAKLKKNKSIKKGSCPNPSCRNFHKDPHRDVMELGVIEDKRNNTCFEINYKKVIIF